MIVFSHSDKKWSATGVVWPCRYMYQGPHLFRGSRPGCKHSTVCLSVTSYNVDSVVLLSNLPCVPYYLVLISVEHCTETTLGKLGHTSSIISWFSIQLHFLKCTKYGNRFILKEFIDNFCQFVYYWHIFWFVTYLKHPCDVREHISLKS